jgi:hypothetical protein
MCQSMMAMENGLLNEQAHAVEVVQRPSTACACAFSSSFSI